MKTPLILNPVHDEQIQILEKQFKEEGRFKKTLENCAMFKMKER